MELSFIENEVLELEDGLYKASIRDVSLREGKFGKFIRLEFDVGSNKVFPSCVFSLKEGKVSRFSDLYKLLLKFEKIDTTKPINPEAILLNKRVSILIKKSTNTKNPDINYYDVIKDSIKSIEDANKRGATQPLVTNNSLLQSNK